MTDKPRFVFDTNVLVSALLFRDSVPGQALREALLRTELLISFELVEELRDVLQREKFDRYVDREVRDDYLRAIVDAATLIEVNEIVDDCRDEKDNMLLALALDGAATAIVTGDNDLLALSPYRGVEIISPAEFLAGLPE